MKSRSLSVILTLVLLLTMILSACSGNKSNNDSSSTSSSSSGSTASSGSSAASSGGEGGSSSLAGKKIEMSILGIGGWVPSQLSVEMSPAFAEYAKEKYGYDVTFTFEEAPFSSLFQKAAASLSTKSQEFNIIISDSQWLGAFAEPGWIVSVNEIMQQEPELANIEWFDPVVQKAYMTYPDGTDQLWGFPQEGDVLVLYVRKDMLSDPTEQANFKAKYGFDLPQTFEDFEQLTIDKFLKMAEFFTRPEQDLYGTAVQYSKEYDYFTGSFYPHIWSSGGEIWDPVSGDVYGVLNTENNAKALETFVSIRNYMPPGAENYGIAQVTEAFTQGKLFSAYHWAAVGAAMITPELQDKVMVVPIPGYEVNGEIKRISSIGGQPWVINKFNDEDHMRVAIDFLKWWYLPETQLEFAKRGGNPTTKAALESPDFDSIQPWFRAYRYSLTESRARDFWHHPKYSELLSIQQEEFTSYLTGGRSSAAETLEVIACKQQQIMYDAGTTKNAPPAACANIR